MTVNPSIVRSTDRSARVRDRLLDVGERLYADHGINAVSLNQIARAADQRNSNVIQYHFGTRESLLKAIAERRMESINARRHELLEQIGASKGDERLKAIARAIVLPYAEASKKPEYAYHIRLAAQLYSDPSLEFFKLIEGPYNSAMRELGRFVDAELETRLSKEVIKHRIALITGLIFTTFAERQKLIDSGKHVGVARLHIDGFADDIIRIVAAILREPFAED
jgi:AcrR family transcriptional regulator